MKVNIDLTIEISDDQRKQLASVLDGKVVRRDATRAEIKEFMWENGSAWDAELAAQYAQLTGETDDEIDLDDLL